MCSTHDKLAKGRFSTHSVLLLTLPLALPTTPESITMLSSASYVLVSPSRVSQGASRSSYSSVLSSISLRLAQFATSVTLRKRNKSPTFYSRWQMKFTRTIVGKLTLFRFLLSFVWLIGIKAGRHDFSLRTLRLCGELDLFDSSRLPLRFPLPIFLRTCSPSSSVVNRSICCSRLERSNIDRGSYKHCQLAAVSHNVRYFPFLRCRACVCQCLGFRKTGNCILCTKCQRWD